MNTKGMQKGLPHGKIFCVDKSLLQLSCVKYLYGCKDPGVKGALLQAHLGLTLSTEDGPNSYYIHNTVTEIDNSLTYKAFFGNFSKYCYVFYGEEHFSTDTSMGNELCRTAAKKIGSETLLHRRNAAKETSVISHLLNNVFCLSEEEKKRAVLYVNVLNPFLISLMEGNLIIAENTVQDVKSITQTYSKMDNAVVTAKSVHLFDPDSVAQNVELLSDIKKPLFYDESVSENVRTAEILTLLSSSGLPFTIENQNLVISLIRDFRGDDSIHLFKKYEH